VIPGLFVACSAIGALGIIVVTSRWRRLRRFRSGLGPLPPAFVQLAWLIARVCAALGTTTHTALRLIRSAERLSASGLFLGRLGEGWPEELWAEALTAHRQRSDLRRRRIAGVGRACFYLAALMLPPSARGRYLRDWLGEIDGLSSWRQIRFSIRVLLRAPATAHVEGSYARLARASVAWAFPRDGTSDEEMVRRLNSINRSAVPEHHKGALGMPVVIGWAWTALGKCLGINTKSNVDNDGTR
jgi:hypothetical protein